MKVDLSSGDCLKLPNWVKITHQNADLLQVFKKRNTTYFAVLCNSRCIWAEIKVIFFLLLI